MPVDNKRYFTLHEVNLLVPVLEARFGKIMQLRSQLRAAYQDLDELGYRPDPDTLQATIENTSIPLEVRRGTGIFRALLETLGEELAAIEATGAAIKDLDIGLCDFLGRRGQQDVWLCWQYGEKSIGYWHPIDAGFSAREPIDETLDETRTLH